MLKEGLEEGHAEGRKEGLLAAARSMLHKGLFAEQVAELSGLPLAEIERLDNRNP